MTKRIIALFLCLSILLTMFIGSAAAEEENYSANVGRYAVLLATPDNASAFRAIKRLVAKS